MNPIQQGNTTNSRRNDLQNTRRPTNSDQMRPHNQTQKNLNHSIKTGEKKNIKTPGPTTPFQPIETKESTSSKKSGCMDTTVWINLQKTQPTAPQLRRALIHLLFPD